MEVDEVIPGTKPMTNETDGGCICAKSKNSKQHVSKSKAQKKSDTCGIRRRNARLRT